MRLNTALIVLSMAVLSAGCSPYLYKGEINEFSKGVNQLAEANTIGVRNANEARANRSRWIWLNEKPKLTLTDGCEGIKTTEWKPCGLKENERKTVSKSTPKVSEPIKEGGSGVVGQSDQGPRESIPIQDDAKAIVKALQDYADGLAAVTNAADREALDKAQAELTQSVGGLATEVAKLSGQPVAAQVKPITDLFTTIATVMLDTRRYQALQREVKKARQPVADLGKNLGDMLTNLRDTQVNALRGTATELELKLGPQFDESTYATRLDALQSTATALEALRSVNPKEAADKMVEAHNELANALAENQGQAEAVLQATKTFFDKAKAVREAFATGADAQKGSK